MPPDATFAPVDRDETLAEKVYARLRSALVGGRLVPGQKLVHRQLAQDLGVSPTPVREALLRLVSEGALDLDARGIAWVPRLPRDRYAEIMELREELEGRAAARAATLATPADIAALRAIHARLMKGRRAEDGAIVLAENERFHFGVIAIARMPVLQRVVENLWTQVGPTISLLSSVPRKISPAGHPHDDLLKALEARDPAAARAAVERDLREHAAIVAPLLDPAAS
ncbi:GntR family transcriptional regulator [Neoroseomonas oryzicola]|uniref:GntR family transcriptional regulator n=1 Tax=Neoroseomonas oryzicola TaxID=535904 RepID=A0A9X9WBI2_9PROT|nr:GntR family transcriptional regulator [Neoroseomonas oryzicola]MBR0657692.1 GntR family transcriptional regulator [Neoroseomonas oryzicola]NKE18948.1 GntR family transcriptional regulator [Neoroseomonas oryzicola]